MNEFIFKSYGNSKQSISYCEVDKCKFVIKLNKCLQEIKEIAKKEKQPYCETWKVDGYSEILQKISEVEDEHN